MARGSLRHEDAQQIGQYIREGTWEAVSVRAIVTKYKSGDKNTVARITARPLTSTFEEVAEGEEKILDVAMGKSTEVHPGHIDAKSFYDETIDPEDLGGEEGTEGNAVFPIKPLNTKWARFEESLRKCGVPSDITKLGVLALFDGMKFHCTTVLTGGTYKNDQGVDTPYSQVLVDRIQKPFPWEKQEVKASSKAAGKVTATKSAPAAVASTNGKPDWSKIDNPAKYIIEHLTPDFFDTAKTKIVRGEAVGFDTYVAAIKRETLRHGVPLKDQNAIKAVLTDAEKLMEIAVELDGHANSFVTDGETIEFVS